MLNRLFAPYDPPCTHLVDRLRYWVAHQPDSVAFYYLTDGEQEEVHLTYAELDVRARAIAAKLDSLGMCGERALMLYPPGLDFIAAFFGCLYAGIVPVPAYPPRRNRNMNRIEAIADDAEARIALTVGDVVTRMQGMLDETTLGQLTWLATDRVSEDLASQWEMPTIDGDTLALLQYTSGSTGTPKGVVLTHANLIHNCGLIAMAFEFSRTGCGMTWLPTYHDMGLLGGVLSPLYFGRHNVLMSPMAFLQKPVRWLRAITRYEVTVSGGPNFAYALCNEKISEEECEGLDLHTWDLAFNGAEPIRPETLDEFTAKFGPYGYRAETHYPCYGMAETALIVTGGLKKQRPIVRTFDAKQLDAHRVAEIDNHDSAGRRLVGCGRILPDEQLAIVDPDTATEVQGDRVGEIWVRSPSVGQGYWKKPQETREVFHAHLDNGDTGTWLRTGDLGFLRDGELFVTGRLKDLIIVRGVNRYPQDIESTVERASSRVRTGGSAAFAVVVEGVEKLVVVCEVERARNVQWMDVIKNIRREVTAEHELPPDAIVLVRPGSIPKTSSGKIQRHACHDSFLRDDLLVVSQQIGWAREDDLVVASGQAPVGNNGKAQHEVNPAIARVVIEHVRAVVKERADEVGLDSNIVIDLGLDSLDRLHVANALEETFGGRFPDDVLQRIETCREVAVAIQTYMPPSQKLVERVEAGTTLKLVGAGPDDRVPNTHYRFHEFPEFVRFQQAKNVLNAVDSSESGMKWTMAVGHDSTTQAGVAVIDFASYNYLGMSGDPVVTEAARDALQRFHTSMSTSRMVSGSRTIHQDLERELAGFLETRAALVVASGYTAAESTIGHLFGRGDLILHDMRSHSCVIKGAELSRARRRPFEHNNPDAVDKFLRDERHQYRRVLIAIDGLYSLEGDYPDLPRFVELKHRHKTMLLVNQAHSLGTLGPHGRGIGEQFHVAADDVDIWVGSLGKALGSFGGFISGNQELVDYLRFTSPASVYMTGLAPASVAAAMTALQLLRHEPERVTKLHANCRLFRNLAKQNGLQTGCGTNTPIVPVMIGDSLRTLAVAKRLRERSIVTQPIIYPAVEEDKTRLRLFISALHTEQQIRTAVDAMASELRHSCETTTTSAAV